MAKLPELTPQQHAAAVDRAGDSLALTSGAGCGKTLVLARRFTTLLLRSAAGGAEPDPFERFVALTFTEKAAQEMLARVRAVLLEALAESYDETDRQKLAEWITELPSAHISTIHSFCAAVLRRYAVEAGVDPSFAVLADELVAAHMLAEAASEAALAAAEAGDEDAAELIATADLPRVIEDVQFLLDRRISWRSEEYADAGDVLDRWRRHAAGVRNERLQALAADAELAGEFNYLAAYECSGKLADYRDEKLGVIRDILNDPDAVTADDLAALSGKPGNAGGAKWKAFRDQLRDFVGRFAAEAIWLRPLGEADERAAEALATLTRLATAAKALYAAAKRSAGVLDFEDLIDLTAALLRDNRGVREALQKRLGQLLVDECQDTDAYQLRMLWDLVAGGPGEPGAGAPAAGKLFLVGDVKQSIYRFRGAQAEVFRELCEQFGPDAHLPLTESFRSHPAGVAFVNHLFARLMDDYEPIVSSRAERPESPSVEILLAAMPEGGRADEAAAAQADVVAGRIAEMIGSEKRVWDAEAKDWRAVRAGDVAVLFARMTKSLEYERALQQRGVPYYVVAGTGFFQQQEVYDVLNALRVIDNPYDDVALLGVLRSSLFGLDDNALLHLARTIEPPYFEKLADPAVADALPGPQAEQLAFARDLLGSLHADKDAVSPAALVEAMVERTGYAAALLSEFRGERKLANVLRLTEAARSAGRAGGVSLADFVRRYGELTTRQTRYEQAPVVGEGDDVVRIMTIHKAKGLEFPVVIVPDLNAGFRGPRGRLLLRPDWGVTYKPAAGAGEDSGESDEDPTAFLLAREAEKEELRAEDVRKLYVAATRHRDHLVLVGADLRNRDGGFSDRSGYLAQLDAVLGIAAAVDDGRDQIPYGDGFAAWVARIEPQPGRFGRHRRSLAQRALDAADDAEQFAEALVEAGAGAKGRPIGLLSDEAVAAASLGRLAPTALADFEHCPMLYRWRHELRAPAPPPAGAGAGPSLDAATAGTLLHRCMELLDFEADLPAQADPLLRRAAAEMELTVEAAPWAAELAAMLERLAAHPLAERLRSADCRLAELTFLFDAGPMTLSGQIDLLYRDPAGGWHVVDYKSDRLEAGDVASHARRYELQMMIYLSAARRHFGDAVADATLYFLRPGATHVFTPAKQAHAAFEKRLAALAEQLTHCRAAAHYPRRADGSDESCAYCPYGTICSRPDSRQQEADG